MNTKTILLAHIHRAKSQWNNGLSELFSMMSQAVMRVDAREIDWHLMNDLSESDVLLLIVLSDTDLTIRYDELVLSNAVNFVIKFEARQFH
ncbi:hypothetical protein [Vibrio mediterranei]|uniref:Uncharacterized protein n=1 Tax=Vibrio mediterranei TaxID=689 RepID=A0AAN1FFH8_9VIBR|nr:hypothetical protein [Vibrio mediterranei]ASI89635.1 hypothetical protein BSZ05_07480 [Vibrio mediterranei]